MEQNIKVSILVPFYKVENYVGRCVESLFTQTYKNIEFIFVNDWTPDGSMEVINGMIEKYNLASKCKMIVHEHNKGISASRNDCLDNMTGDFFLFVDSDDYIDQDMVELLVEAAIKEGADISGCGYIEEYEDHSVEHPQKYTNNHDEMMRAITLLTIKGVMWKLLVRSTIVTEHKDEVRFIPDRNMVDDYLFCCQIFYYAKRFASVDRCMYHWIQYNPNNYTHTTVFAVESQAAAIRKTEEFYREKGFYDVVKAELMQRKFISKLPLLFDKECIDVVRWRNLFPESNNIWKNMNFSLGNKLLFQLAKSPFYMFIPLLLGYLSTPKVEGSSNRPI
jgi:glycosyltransferase involved in cell wall biosynthesis